MKVLVIGSNGIGLMPTTPRKARKLLDAGKAEVIKKLPFTIQLNYQTGSATQKIMLGIDTGESHIGVAVVAEDKVLIEDEIELRKSKEKRKLLETRRSYRRKRRYRKTPYRHPKFRFHRKRIYVEEPKGKKKKHWQKQPIKINTSRKKGWVPPSIQSKVAHHINWIHRFLNALPKGTVLNIEVARFDIQKMKKTNVHKELYCRKIYETENLKAYVLAKFNYTCPVCGHKFDRTHKARMHHILYKSNGSSDNPDVFAPICNQCHTSENHKKGKVLDELRKACREKSYRELTFMNILRHRLFQAFPNANFTYGNITNADRKILGLSKTHGNDAIAIALLNTGINHVKLPKVKMYIKQIRAKKRSLHEANARKGRKEPNRTSKRNSKNTPSVGKFQLYDEVYIPEIDKTGFISGFAGKSAYVKTFDGTYIMYPGKKYKQIPLSKMIIIHHRYGNYITKTVCL